MPILLFHPILMIIHSATLLCPTTRPPDLTRTANQRVNTLLYSPLLPLPSPLHPLPLHLHPSILVLVLLLFLHLLSLIHPLPPPPPLSSSRLSLRCITHQSTCTPLRMRVRWPWGRGGACWRVRVEPYHCSLMGEWWLCKLVQTINRSRLFHIPQFYPLRPSVCSPYGYYCTFLLPCLLDDYQVQIQTPVEIPIYAVTCSNPWCFSRTCLQGYS